MNSARHLWFYLLCALLPLEAATADGPSCKIAQEAIESAIRIRGLKKLKSVPCYVHDKTQVRAYLLEQLKTKIPPERLRNEEIIFRTLGFIPKDFDYSQGIIDLYTSQIGGYYDPEKKHFVMAGWMPEFVQPVVSVHELTHALQDQHFDLGPFTDMERYTTDELLARMALVEGDATAVMSDYQRQMIGQGSIGNERNIDTMLMSNVMGGALAGSASGAPESLQTLLLFPYTSGLRFAHTLLQGGGYKAIDAAFKNPPRSTREILHPEEFGKGPDHPPAVISATGHRDTFGEFFIAALLGGHSKDKRAAASAAAGWKDDVLTLEGGKIEWEIKLETEKDAKELEDEYGKVLEKLYNRASYLQRKGDTILVSIPAQDN